MLWPVGFWIKAKIKGKFEFHNLLAQKNEDNLYPQLIVYKIQQNSKEYFIFHDYYQEER